MKYAKMIKMTCSLLGKEMPAGLGFMVQAILGMMGSQSLLYVRALSVLKIMASLLAPTTC